MWRKIIAFFLVYVDETKCTSVDSPKLRSLPLLTPDNASVPECKQLKFEVMKKQGVKRCTVKSETFEFGQQLGAGGFAVVYEAANNQGAIRAIKFVKNQHDTETLKSIEQENSVMKKLQENSIPNVAIIEEPSEIDENANVFVIGMKRYYKDVNKFIDEDVPRFGWDSLDMLRFVAKIGVKYKAKCLNLTCVYFVIIIYCNCSL